MMFVLEPLAERWVSIWASFSLGDLFQTMLSGVLGTVASYAVGWLIGKCRPRK